MLTEVSDEGTQQRDVVIAISQHSITSTAQQPANFLGLMVVVDGECPRDVSPFAGFGLTANGADAALFLK
jgi:hypothetical protein